MMKTTMNYEEARHLVEDGVVTKMTTVDTETLCVYFRCTPKTLKRRMDRGLLPQAMRFGRNNLWRLAEIRKAIEAQQKKFNRRA